MSDNNKIDVFAMIDEYMKKKDHEEAVKMIEEYIEEVEHDRKMAQIMAMAFMPIKKSKKQKRKELVEEIIFRMFYLAIGLIITGTIVYIIK